MSITFTVPTKLGECLSNKEVNFNSDTFKIGCATSAYTFNRDTHKYLADVTNTISGSVVTLGTVTVTSDATNHQTIISWPNPTITVAATNGHYFYIYDDTPATNKPLCCVFDYGVDQNLTPGFTVQFNSSGVIALPSVQVVV